MLNFDIQTVKDRLLVKYPAFASTIVNANYYEANIKTLCTDGKDIYYNPNYLNNLSFDEQLFALAHEICHIRSNHIMRSKNKNSKLWNIATDAVINQLLKEDGLTLPQNVIIRPDAINYSAEDYYEKLLQQTNQSESEENQTGVEEAKDSNESQESAEQNDTSSSLPDMNEENQTEQEEVKNANQSQENTEQNNLSDTNSSNNEESSNSDENYNNPSNIDDHSMWNKAIEKEDKENSEEDNQDIDEQELFSQNRKEKIENLKRLKDELLKESMQAGNDSNNIKFSLNNIGANKPLIDWRILLRKSINIKLKWDTRRPEVEYGVLVPRLHKMAYPRTEILLDTSGSIDEEMLRNFLRECKYILQNTEMSVGCFDTKFYGFQKINNENDIENMTFYGRGGTDFDVAVNAFTNRVDNKIIFTDGEADMPKKPSDAIWVVFGNYKINPLGGKVIYINENQLKELKTNKKRR